MTLSSLLSVEGGGFLVAIAVSLILAAAVTYYSSMKLRAMDEKIKAQTTVIQQLVATVSAGALPAKPAPAAVEGGGSTIVWPASHRMLRERHREHGAPAADGRACRAGVP